MNRREFIGRVVSGVGVAGCASLLEAAAADPITPQRGFAAGKFALELAGRNVGWLRSASGGSPTADVFSEKMGADHIVRKHLGAIKYEDMLLAAGSGMGTTFYQWIAASMAGGSPTHRDGVIQICDYNFKPLSGLMFHNGFISSVAFPALDLTSKEAAGLAVTVVPEYTRMSFSTGIGQSASTIPSPAQKIWTCANFKLKIDGLEDNCSHVNKIEPLVWKTKLTSNPAGELRNYTKEPTFAEVPDLVITLPEIHSSAFYAWLEDFLVRGHNDKTNEKSGQLDFTAPNGAEVLMSFKYGNLGIYRIEPDIAQAAELVRRVQVSMYCDTLTMVPGAISA